MKPLPLKNPGPLESFDERDTVFARARLQAGDGNFERYYRAHPEKLETDERFRAQPNLASAGGRRYRAAEAVLVESQFAASDLVAAAVECGDLAPERDDTSAQGADAKPGRDDVAAGARIPEGLGLPSQEDKTDRLPDESPAALTRFVKDAAFFLGADDVGVAPLDAAHVYSRRGRPTAKYGEEVALEHRHAVVLVFRMRHEYIQAGPEMIGTAETARVYQQAAAACYALADSLKRLGFAARAHVDSNYLVICPPLAVAAGLGELGRHGMLIHPVFGPELRLGVVTVDAELESDAAGCWGIAEFCRRCEKCAKLCPSAAIPRGDSRIVRGAEKWPLEPENCYHYWRSQGTDCGVCLRVCPFAKHDSLLHRVVRQLVASTTIFNRFFLKCDDWIYGASTEPSRVPRIGCSEPPGPDS